MASPPRTREEERRLNARTLAIASAASASAAAVTSQLWIAGTWIAAAVTPLIVAIVSELLHRPSERIARAITSDRPALQLDDSEESPARGQQPDPGRPSAARPCACTGSRRHRPARGAADRAPRCGRSRGPGLLIGAAALTAAELIAGQSIGKGDRATSLVGGKSRKTNTSTTEERARAGAGHDRRARGHAAEEPRTVTVTVPTETEHHAGHHARTATTSP